MPDWEAGSLMKRTIVISSIVLILSLASIPKFHKTAAAPVIPAGLISATSTAIEPGDVRADLIDGYFRRKKMPLAGMGEAMVRASDREDLDWRLLPALAVRESTGGRFACGKNPFGWASCRRTFGSWEEAIDAVSAALGHGRAYRGKTLRAKLETYNPPSIVPTYAAEVMAIMADIGPAP